MFVCISGGLGFKMCGVDFLFFFYCNPADRQTNSTENITSMAGKKCRVKKIHIVCMCLFVWSCSSSLAGIDSLYVSVFGNCSNMRITAKIGG